MMTNQWRLFLTALMFYTRIPILVSTKWLDYSEQNLNLATRYFPLIGWIVGGICAGIFYLSQLFLPLSVALILSLIAGVLTTGAFHEDGFADVCDGFGGGWTSSKILTIMKDSAIGAYGTVGLVLLFLLKFWLLLELAQKSVVFMLFALWTSHSLGRFSAICLRIKNLYVRDADQSKAKPIATQTKVSDYLVAAFFGFAPLFFWIENYTTSINSLSWSWILLVLFPALGIWYLRSYFKKWIGGYTGDCLGAAEQVSEVLIYLAALAIYPAIKGLCLS